MAELEGLLLRRAAGLVDAAGPARHPEVVPKEEYPAAGLRESWHAGPAMEIVAGFEASLKRHPPIPPGTPDPYTLPR